MRLNSPICEFGWQAPDFTLLDADGNSYKMSEHLGDKGLLIMFICNHCPYVQAAAERIATDARELIEAGINVLAVMSNAYKYVPADSPENMKIFADMHHFTFPYLIDEGQEVGRAYGAICTPDFFGFNNQGQLQYRGRLDDTYMADSTHRKRELVTAMLQIAETGQGPEEQFPSMGCSIKWG